jgi:hypothetical protein
MGVNLVTIVRNFSISHATFGANDHDVQDGCVTPGPHRVMRFDFLSHNAGDADLVGGFARSPSGSVRLVRRAWALSLEGLQRVQPLHGRTSNETVSSLFTVQRRPVVRPGNDRIVPGASNEKAIRLVGSPSVGIIFIDRSTGL